MSLATPAALRTEVVEQAVALRCHVLCEKPLATTVKDAKRMYTLVREAGVKHAYAATQRYEPSVLWLAELISDQDKGYTPIAVTRQRVPEPEPLPTPQRLLDTRPQVGNDLQNKWTALASDFVSDIPGEDHKAYLTFQDGWRYQAAIETIREGKGWYRTPEGAR